MCVHTCAEIGFQIGEPCGKNSKGKSISRLQFENFKSSANRCACRRRFHPQTFGRLEWAAFQGFSDEPFISVRLVFWLIVLNWFDFGQFSIFVCLVLASPVLFAFRCLPESAVQASSSDCCCFLKMRLNPNLVLLLICFYLPSGTVSQLEGQCQVSSHF